MKRYLAIILAMVTFFTFTTSMSAADSAQSPQPNNVTGVESNTWIVKNPMPTELDYPGIETLNNKIYVFGGTNSQGKEVSDLRVYDPVTEKWETKASMPNATAFMSTAISGGLIYSVGGGGVYTNAPTGVYAYDPSTDQWSTKAALNVPRYYLGVVELNGKIYAIGGFDNSIRPTNVVEEYDPATNTWTKKASLNVSRADLTVQAYNGKIYAMGGWRRDDSGTYDVLEVEEYNPSTDTWTIINTTLSERRIGSTSVLVNNQIYVIGGGGSNPKGVEAYDIDNNTWVTKPSLNHGRAGSGATIANNKIYVLGGTETPGVPSNVVEEYTLGKNTDPVTPPDPVDPEVPVDLSNRAILEIIMTNGLDKEYDLSITEVNAFISWYEAKQAGTGTASYAINKHNNNKGPFTVRKDYVIFDKILTFEVSEYSIK
ncbi:Kelch repeat-containing protein [Paenibacillus apiarius]|uniref:Kelch repeat-containing protein n=1 Tax=Paenibacillus apiarius TaxID=46240 RepID=UPI003B3B1D8B